MEKILKPSQRKKLSPLRQRRIEKILDRLSAVTSTKGFFYHPFMKTTAHNLREIYCDIKNSSVQALDSLGIPKELSRQDSSEFIIGKHYQECTPLQAHLLEVNFGYVRLE